MQNLIKMPVLEERRVTKSGSSFIMTLPKEWVEEQKIKEGDRILLRANGHIEIRVKSDENLKLMNQEIQDIRNSLNHTPRSDDQHKGRETSSPSKLEE